MPSTFLGLNTGLSGLNYFQAALNTTGHNISNSNTKGYSRQTVLSQAAQALRVSSSYGMMGTGVKITEISQFRNHYYDTKYRAAASKMNEYTAAHNQLLQLEAYLNEEKSEAGYTKLLAELNGALQDLSRSPADATYRTQFIQSASNFTDFIKEIATDYQNTQTDINGELAIHVSTINSISSQIYALNQQIVNIEIRGGNANDLRDQRELLVDQLSELVTVDVVETPIMYGTGEDAVDSGATNFEVRIAGALLVDQMESRQLTVVARQEKVNQNDIDGLYDIFWLGINDTIGEKLNFNTTTITGCIKGLLQVRDGNNANPFSGEITAMDENTPDGSTATVKLAKDIDVDKLNLPMEGTIKLNCKDYYYEGFEADYSADGKLNGFTFKNLTVTDDTGKRVPAEFDTSLDLGKEAIMGESIDCRGIPYYMTQLNEFVRTFSNYMNEIFKTGADANGDPGMDFYTAVSTVTGVDYVLPNNKDIEDGTITSLSSAESNYYQLTALNWSINKSIMADQNKLVVSLGKDIAQDNLEAKDEVLGKIIYGMTDQSMFAQGTMEQFLQSITTALAVDISKYDSFEANMNEVTTVINNQRLSISSVDTNEEASNLIIFKEGYNLACKVISVMNEVYDKLINQTGL
ncbi:MAG: flagellar hook-associated protein FlgK [Lachnospiraceae bacterium]|nr:flagellar hook-associated protein FlgK [Lachnospiraceae bacterium]MDE6625157.1 flagellar hook-associated protein FlgK [Lachnospiraceae bacterium]